MKPKDVIKRYRRIVNSSFSEKCLRNILILKIVIILALAVNYIIAFTSLYYKHYIFLYEKFGEIILAAYPSLGDIQRELIESGKYILFQKYFIFTFVNFSIIVSIPLIMILIFVFEKSI